MKNFSIKPIGIIRSDIKKIKDAPLFYNEGAPDVSLEIFPEYSEALHRIKAGDELIVITWLHLGKRDVLKVHPRGNPANPVTGVFLTRSPDRPNPIGLHRCSVREINGIHLKIGPLEVIDGTPVIDIKAVVGINDY